MEKTTKYYKNRFGGHGRTIEVAVDWNPDFLQLIVNRFGLNNEGFSSSEIEDAFKYKFPKNSIRLRLRRLYKRGFFSRKKEALDYSMPGRKNIFLYSFTESAKRYYYHWGSFNENEDSPLLRNLKNKTPEIIERRIEVKKEFISSDRFLGEL